MEIELKCHNVPSHIFITNWWDRRGGEEQVHIDDKVRIIITWKCINFPTTTHINDSRFMHILRYDEGIICLLLLIYAKNKNWAYLQTLYFL